MNALIPFRHRFLAVLFFLAGTLPAFSQVLNILTPPSPANYPTVTSNVQVLEGGVSKRDFQNGDFEVSEGGPFLPATINCAPVGAKPAVDILLVNDISISMIDPREGQVYTRLDLLKSALSDFLLAIDFNTGTTVGMTVFADYADMPSNGFKNNLSTLSPIPPSLTVAKTYGTFYNKAFFDENYGGLTLFKKRAIKTGVPRVIIFLTDGQPTDEPPFSSTRNAVIQQALNPVDGQVIIFAIMLDKKMNPDLMAVSQATGGEAYELVTTSEQLIGIYRRIAEKIQGIQPCVLSWQSEVKCGEENVQRKVQIRYKKNVVQKTSYLAPPQSVAALEQDKFVVPLGSPVPPDFTTDTIVIRARNYPFTVTSGTLSGDPDFTIDSWGKPIPFTLAPGDSTTIVVRFTPIIAETYRSAKLTINAFPCNPQSITLWGGELPIDKSPITLFAPNGGVEEGIISTCLPTLIRWGGIPSYIPVTISYSDNDGANWTQIVQDLADSTYSWLPPAVGVKYRIKVESTQNYANWIWARKAGGSGVDRAIGVAADRRGNAYILGEYSGTATIDTIKLSQVPPAKRFLACYNSQGRVVWAVKALNGARAVAQDPSSSFTYVITTGTISQYISTSGTLSWTLPRAPGSTKLDSLRDVAVDGSGSVYVTGCYILNQGPQKAEYQMYIAKYDANKNPINGVSDGWKNLNTNAIVGAQPWHMAVDENGNVLVAGTYDGSAGFLTGKVPVGGFIIKYDREGNFQWVMPDGIPTSGSLTTAGLAYKKEGDFFYQTGSLNGNATFGGKSISAAANLDAFLVKYDANSRVASWASRITGASDESAVDVDVDSDGNPYVAGWLGGTKVTFEGSSPLSVSNTTSGRKDLFIAKYTSAGVPFFATSGGGTLDDKAVAIAANNSRCFMVGNFLGGAPEHPTFGAYKLVSGDTDLVVGSIGVILKGSDMSDAAFKVVAPELVIPDTLDAGEEFVGTVGERNFGKRLHNTGDIELHITGSIVTGTNPNDFKVEKIDIVIPPHDSTDIGFGFAPSNIGKRIAFLVIEGDCVPKDSIVLVGVGKPVCISTIDQYDLDSSDVNQKKSEVFNKAICNKGPLPINVIVNFTGPNASDYAIIVNSNPETNVTIHLEPGDCADLTIQFTPSTSGNRNAQMNLSVQGCSDFQAQVLGYGIPGSASVDAADTFIGVVDCKTTTSEAYVYINNAGGSDLKIESVEIQNNNSGFGVVPLANTLIIPRFGRDSVKVTFNPLTAGAKTADLVISSSTAGNSPFIVKLTGRRDSVQISGNALAFGTLRPTDFGTSTAQKTLILTNTGSIPTLISGNIPGANFTIVSGLPANLPPGGTVSVVIEFADPGANGDYIGSLDLISEPNCGPIAFAITGRKATAEARLSMPVLTGDVHAKDFHIPIMLTPGTNFALAKDNVYKIKVSFNKTLFRPHSFTNGATMESSAFVGDDQEIIITGKAASENAGPLTEIIGDVLLGNVEQTHLLLSIVSWADLAVDTDSGSLSVEGICRDGGSRLTQAKSSLAIKKIAPNPAGEQTDIEVQTIELGRHVLEIYDMNGRSVFQHVWTESPSPSSKDNIIPVETSKFPVGAYQIIVRTPTRILKEILSVVR